MPSPLSFQDLFGYTHIEPSVTGLMEVETELSPRPNTFNDLIIISPFRSGPTGTLERSRTLSHLQSLRDPDRTGDRGVALGRIAKAPFADDGVFGAADILSLRLDSATNPAAASSRTVQDGSNHDVFKVSTADLGGHTARAFSELVADGTGPGGSKTYRKLTLGDDTKLYVGEKLGLALNIKYTGAGTTANVTVCPEKAVLTVGPTTPTTGDKVTVNGLVYTYGTPTGQEIAVVPGANFGTAATALANAIATNQPSLSASVAIGATTAVVTITGGAKASVAGTNVALAVQAGATGRLFVTAASATADNLDIPFSNNLYRSIGQLASFIDSQPNYTCSLNAYALSSDPCSGLDHVSGVDCKAPADGLDLTQYAAAITAWVNTKTRKNFVAENKDQAYAPANDASGRVALAGGRSPVTYTTADFDAALDIVSANVEVGGVLLVDSDSAAVWSLVNTWIGEMRSQGKWFRAYFGCPAATLPDQAINLAGSLDSSRCRLTQQRVGVFSTANTIEYLDPIFFAAMLAGGVCGNKPYIHPLTNKRLRIAGIHPDDSHSVEVRERLLDGGITVVKAENETFRVALHVTTSRDPDRRMPRIASEIDTVDMVDANFRQAFLPFRGKWATVNTGAQVFGVGGAVLTNFVKEGALTPGYDTNDVYVPAYRWEEPAFTLYAGVLSCRYEVRIAGELNHASLHGNAEYAKLVGTVSGGVQQITSTVPVK